MLKNNNPKIVFDRSAFHPNRYYILKSSKLEKLVKNKSVTIYHTPTFLYETLQLFSNEKNRKILKEQISFILQISKKWFKRREVIIFDELVNSFSHKNYEFIKKNHKTEDELNLNRYFIKELISEEDLEKIEIENESNRNKSIENKDLFRNIREEFSSDYSKDKKNGLIGEDFYNYYLHDHIDPMGKYYIEKHLNIDNKSEIYNKWISNKKRYSYFTKYIEGLVYCIFFPFTQPNIKIDEHATADIEYLCFLKKIDIFVSNDEKFMKKAFEQLYIGEDKIFLTVNEFIEFLDNY